MRKLKFKDWKPSLWGALGGIGVFVGVGLPALLNKPWWYFLSIPIGGLWVYWTFRVGTKVQKKEKVK